MRRSHRDGQLGCGAATREATGDVLPRSPRRSPRSRSRSDGRASRAGGRADRVRRYGLGRLGRPHNADPGREGDSRGSFADRLAIASIALAPKFSNWDDGPSPRDLAQIDAMRPPGYSIDVWTSRSTASRLCGSDDFRQRRHYRCKAASA
jgi:hypothetical protein